MIKTPRLLLLLLLLALPALGLAGDKFAIAADGEVCELSGLRLQPQ